MTTDELKKEAEESLDKRLGTYAYIRKQDCYTNYVDGYMDSAEPREKRIAELEKQLDIERDERNLFQERCEDILENYYCDHPCKCAELEQENAELKEKFNAGNISFEDWLIYCKKQGLNLATQEMEQKEIDEMLENCWIASRYNSDATSLCLKQSVQITKAKKLIERLLLTSCNSDVLNLLPNCSEVLQVRVEAEQFLSEVEK